MKDIYNICFYGGLTLAIILLITSIVLFIVFKIPKVIGDLTGRNARREIAEKKSRKGRTDTGSKLSRQEQKKYYNQSTGKITIRDSATNEQETVKITSDIETVEPEERETDILRPEDEADINVKGSASGSEEETTVLEGSKGEEETTILGGSKGEEETTILEGGAEKPKAEAEEFDPDAETDVLRADEADREDEEFDPDAETDILRNADVEEDEEATDVLKSNEKTKAVTQDVKAKTASLSSTVNINDTKDNSRYIYDVIVVHTDESLS